MAAPNIVTVSSIIGVTTFTSGISTTTPSVIISNANSSGTVLKLNTLMAANTTSTTATITVKIFNAAAGAGSSVSIASTIPIPSGSSLAILGKDTPIYIEENRSIGAIAGTANAIDIITSYEIIS
jgi:N-glycosylase/DNA lyase